MEAPRPALAATAGHPHVRPVMKRLALLILLLLVPTMAPAQEFPKLTGRVVDAADILPPEVEARISARSEAIDKQTTAELVVVTVPSLEGAEIEDYGYRLGRAWKLGKVGKQNAAILLVAPNDRRVRIEVGQGLEPILTDALTSVIIRQAIIPEFRAGNFPAGVEAGFDAIARQVELPAEEAARNVAAADAAASNGGDGGFPAGLVFFLILLFVWIAISSSRGKAGRRARRGGPIVVWGPGMGSGWGGGGGFGGGGFGGGGFSGGGGGGFSGGGASGGW